jgi:chromosomal replication initiator protein
MNRAGVERRRRFAAPRIAALWAECSNPPRSGGCRAQKCAQTPGLCLQTPSRIKSRMTSPPKVWDGVLRRLGSETSAVGIEAWIQPLAVQEEPDRLLLLAPSTFHRDRVRTHFASRIGCLAAEVGGRPLAVSVEVSPGAAPLASAPLRCAASAAPEPRAALAAEPSRPSQLVLPATFDTFVTGASNALAREASLAVAQGRQPALFPLFLLGESGIGKSHLARAAVHEARRRGNVRAVYASAERFTSEFTSAIRARQGGEFRRRYRQECDLLVLEDVQFLAAKEATQLELLHTVEHLRLIGARVVLTADRLPRRIPSLSPRLASQMGGGLVAEMELPDRSLRRDILRDKASRGGIALPPDCLELLVDGVRGSVRDLEGALTQLVATASLLRCKIDRALTEAALRKLEGPLREVLSLEAVLDCVGSFFGLTRAQLASRSRAERLRHPRQVAMYLCRRFTDASLSEIGRVLGRNHPAVANAITRVERAILERAPLRYQVEALAARLEGSALQRGATAKGAPGARAVARDRAPRGSDAAR